jgi:endonuclease IV
MKIMGGSEAGKVSQETRSHTRETTRAWLDWCHRKTSREGSRMGIITQLELETTEKGEENDCGVTHFNDIKNGACQLKQIPSTCQGKSKNTLLYVESLK